MKNKEEPLAHSRRGNSWRQVDLPLAGDEGHRNAIAANRRRSAETVSLARHSLPSIDLIKEMALADKSSQLATTILASRKRIAYFPIRSRFKGTGTIGNGCFVVN